MLPHLLLPGAYCMAGLRFPDRAAWRHYLVCVRHRHYGLSSSHFQNGNGVLQNAAGSGCPENPPLEQISKLRADVIFIQGCSNHNRTLKFAYSIFGRTSYIKQIGSCAIIVRHGQIGPAQSITDTAGLIVDWIPENSSLAIRLINISLEPFEHRFDLYSPACWKYFHTLRFIHRKQLQYLFDTLREVGSQHGELPIILAGNFSAAPQSPIFAKLSADFQDCFKLKGAGYGATQPVNFPLLRLDRVFCTPPLKPERAATVLIPDTVRRSILADIAMP